MDSPKIFLSHQSLFRALIWGRGHARITLETLQLAKDEEGLAVPNPFIYYLATQLQPLRGWEADTSEDTNVMLLQHHINTSNLYEALESKMFRAIPTLHLIHKLWRRLWEMGRGGRLHSLYCDLGRSLAELGQILDFESWKTSGIKQVSHLVTENVNLKSVTQLQTQFGIPHSQFYKYLRLRHAY